MKFKLLIKLLLFSIVVSLYGAEKEDSEKSKIAIVVQSDKGELLADSIMVSLSEQNIICLERAQIKKVLKEHKLSASGLTTPASIIKYSRLLKVDIFAVIICSPKTKMPVGIVAFDTKLGIRLVDACLPKNFEEQIQLAVSKIIAAISKVQLLNDNKLKLISFLPLNQIALQGKDAESTRLVELMLMNLIGRNKDVIVLERDHLDFLLKERSMNLAIKNQLLGGSLFIQLETGLTGNEPKSLFLKLFAKNISGKAYFSLKESYVIGNETEIAIKISNQVIKKLELTVFPNNFDRIAESKKYLTECRLAQANGMYSRASRMARNAYALNSGLKSELITIESEIVKSYLSHPGSEPVQNDLKSAVGHAEFIFDINDNSNETIKKIKQIMHSLSRMNTYWFRKEVSQQLKARIIKLRKQAASVLLKNYKRKYKQVNSIASVEDMKNVAERINEINNISRIICDSSINTKYGLPLKKLYITNIDRFHSSDCFSVYSGFDLFAPGQKPRPESSLNELYRSMQKTSNPYFKVIGTFHLHAINYPKSARDPSYVDFLIEILDKYKISDKDWRALVYFFNKRENCFIRKIPGNYGLKLCYSIYKKKGYNHQLFSQINYNGKSDGVKGCIFMMKIQADTKKNKNLTAAAKKKILYRTEMYIKQLRIQFNIPVPKAPSRSSGINQVYQRCFNIVPAGNQLSQPLYDGKNIYVVGIKGRSRLLYKISPENNFSNKTSKKLFIPYKQLERDHWEKYLACFSEKNYVMATSAGLFIFPIDLSLPRFIPLKEFKGFSCYGVACLNEKVYISYNKSVNSRKTPLFLVEYDLQKKSYSVIYASHQNENNPFIKNNLNKFQKIYADSVRNRLIVPVWSDSRQIALWALNPSTRTWKKLSTLPYYPQDTRQSYHPFIIKKNKDKLFIIGNNVAYEFNAINNQYKIIFYSGCENYIRQNIAPRALVKKYIAWNPLRRGWSVGKVRLVDYAGGKLWAAYRLIFLEEKKTLSLMDNINNRGFIYAYFTLKDGRFVIGSNHNVVPNGSLMAQELKSDSKLLSLPDCISIAP